MSEESNILRVPEQLLDPTTKFFVNLSQMRALIEGMCTRSSTLFINTKIDKETWDKYVGIWNQQLNYIYIASEECFKCLKLIDKSMQGSNEEIPATPNKQED